MAIRGIRNQHDGRPLPPSAPSDPLGAADDLRRAGAGPTIDLTTTPAGVRYSAWADRMRDKRRRDQARIRGIDLDDSTERSNWRSDTVLGRSGPHEVTEEVGSPRSDAVTERLGVLGLQPGASSDEIALAYRRLAKLHHPDRWAEADEATQQHHSEEMLRVNAAYRALRTVPIG